MFQFREDLKVYLENCFANDSSITASKKPKIYNGYQAQHEPKATEPEVQIRPLDNSEQTEFTTFCNKHANSVPLQFGAYTGQLTIGGVKYNAQDASDILGEKIEHYINEYIYSLKNKNIQQGRLVSTSPALPMNDGGSVYTTFLRFDFIVAYPYEVGQTS